MTAVFMVLLLFPFVNGQLQLFDDIAATENRQKAAKPKFKLDNLDVFPSQFEHYFNDNFPLRSRFIKYYNRLSIVTFKKSPIPNHAVIGKDGWLFGTGKELDAYTGRNYLSSEELKCLQLELEFRQKYVAQSGAKFYFLIAPAKANIYPEYMPFNVFLNKRASWGEQFNQYLVKNSTVKPIDVFPVLKNKDEKEPFYYKLDVHMNQLGGFYTSNEILKRIHLDYPLVKPFSISDYNIVKTDGMGGDLSNMFGNLDLFKDKSFTLMPKLGFKATAGKKFGYLPIEGFAYPESHETVNEIKSSDLPKILIISDSFGGIMFPFLSESFSKTVKIFDAWQYKLNEDVIKNEKPDIVLLIVWEPHLRSILDFQSRLQ